MQKTGDHCVKKAIIALGVSLLCSITPGLAQEVFIPAKVGKRDMLKTAPDGSRMTGLAIPATIAIRLPSAEITVFYGYIVGKSPKAPSWTWSYNDLLDMTCWTRMAPRKDGSASGSTTCTSGGARISKLPVAAPPGKYGTLKGTIVQRARATDGQPYTYVFRWSVGRHPDAAPLVKALQK